MVKAEQISRFMDFPGQAPFSDVSARVPRRGCLRSCMWRRARLGACVALLPQCCQAAPRLLEAQIERFCVCLVSRPSAMWHLHAPGSAIAVRHLLRRPLCLPTRLHRGQERPRRAASVIKRYSLPVWDPEVDFSTSTSARRSQEEPGRALAPRARLLGTWRAPHGSAGGAVTSTGRFRL